MRRAEGFTLIEVLVALVVITLALAWLSFSLDLAARTTTGERERMLAHWVAENVITRYRIDETWPELGDEEGDEPMSGRNWRWRATVQGTEVDSLRRLEVEVWRPDTAIGDARPVLSRVAFLGRQRSRLGGDVWGMPEVEDDEEEDGG